MQRQDRCFSKPVTHLVVGVDMSCGTNHICPTDLFVQGEHVVSGLKNCEYKQITINLSRPTKARAYDRGEADVIKGVWSVHIMSK